MAEIEDLQTTIAQSIVDELADADWSSVAATYFGTAAMGGSEATVRRADGSTEDWLLPIDATLAFNRLRDAMATPAHGTWITATVSVERADLDFSFDFDYDAEPAWPGVPPLPETWVDDMETYPRPWNEIPAWHPVRQKYTEQTWESIRTRTARA